MNAAGTPGETSRYRPALDALIQDAVYGLRLMWRHPGFSAVAILTLALGIGANTAMFSVIHAVFFRPLPYHAPERLVQFHYEVRGTLQGSRHYGTTYRFLRDHLRSYSQVASFMHRGAMPLVHGAASEPIRVLAVAPEYFTALGTSPSPGRTFTAEEAAEHGADAVVLSHSLWQRTFHADVGAVGRTVLLGGRPHVIVGVMPAAFVSRPAQDAWIPLRRGSHEGGTNLGVVARLRDGVTLARAQSELDAAMPAWHIAAGRKAGSGSGSGSGSNASTVMLRLRPFQHDAGEWLGRPLTVLMTTVALVLLIACANLANLLLARATTRVREMAVRATLGASRARLIRQLIAESLVLASAGGLLGVLLARWTMPALLAISPVDQEFWGEIGLDPRVLVFAAALSLATGVLFGIAPALQATRLDLSQSTKEGGRQSSGRRTSLLRQGLIVGQVAVSVTLLIGALLLVRTFHNLTAVDPGFDARGVTVGSMGMENARYATAEAASRFYREGLERIRRIPGVESAAVISNAPIGGGLNIPFISRAANSDGTIQVTDSRYITPDYFRVMRTPIVAGRGITDADTATSPRVAMVNQRFVKTFLHGLDPIGQRLQLSVPARADDRDVVEIIGVVGDMKQRSLSEAAPETIYVPVTQMSDAGIRQVHVWFETHWVVRMRTQSSAPGQPSRGDDDGAAISPLIETLPRAVRAIDPLQPFSRVMTMTTLIDRSLTSQRFHMLLIGACAMLATVLAAAGLFGVISYVVAQRSHEMGVRLALGATAARLVGSVAGQGIALAALGVVIGVAGAFGVTRLMTTFMFGISPTDPLTFMTAATLLLVLAALAALVPALRLTRLDPATVLRRS